MAPGVFYSHTGPHSASSDSSNFSFKCPDQLTAPVASASDKQILAVSPWMALCLVTSVLQWVRQKSLIFVSPYFSCYNESFVSQVPFMSKLNPAVRLQMWMKSLSLLQSCGESHSTEEIAPDFYLSCGLCPVWSKSLGAETKNCSMHPFGFLLVVSCLGKGPCYLSFPLWRL